MTKYMHAQVYNMIYVMWHVLLLNNMKKLQIFQLFV